MTGQKSFKWRYFLWLMAIPYFFGWLNYENGRGNGFFIYLILFSALAALFHFFIKFFYDLIDDPMTNGISIIKRVIWIGLLSVLIQVSFYRRLFDYYTWEYLAISIGRFTTIFVSLFCTHHWLQDKGWEHREDKAHRWRLLLYALPSLVLFAITWLAFYPAIMSPDSLYIWRMGLENGPYNSLHPLLYTLLVKLLMILWQSPSVVVLFQILLCTAATVYIAWRLDTWGLHPAICFLFALICPIIPANLMYSVTIWKDIPYSIGLLLMMVELIRSLIQKNYHDKWQNGVGLGIIFFFTMSMRHNGLLVVAATMALLLLYLLIMRYKRKAIYMVLVTVGAIVIFLSINTLSKAILGDNYQETNGGIMLYGIPVQGMVAMNHDAKEQLTEEEKDIINKYLDMEGVAAHQRRYPGDYWRYYGRAFNTANTEAILKDQAGFVRDYLSMALKYPHIAFKSYAQQTSLIWCSRQCFYISNIAWGVFQEKGYPVIEEKSYLPEIKEWMLENFGRKITGYREALWHPAVAMLGMLVLLGIAWRRWKWAALAVMGPALFNAMTYLISIEAQDTRYIYVNYTAFFVFAAFALIKRERNSANTQEEAAKEQEAK